MSLLIGTTNMSAPLQVDVSVWLVPLLLVIAAIVGLVDDTVGRRHGWFGGRVLVAHCHWQFTLMCKL